MIRRLIMNSIEKKNKSINLIDGIRSISYSFLIAILSFTMICTSAKSEADYYDDYELVRTDLPYEEQKPTLNMTRTAFIIGSLAAISAGTGILVASTPKGSKGSSGSHGPNGFPGADGANGQNGLNGLNAFGAMGPVGSLGSRGPTGLSGATGITGPTGPGGNTGLPGFGPTGLGGALGPTGIIGNSGPLGTTGLTGLTGTTGANGTGPTGATGAGGNTGRTGLTGNTGATGKMGNTGIRGSSGFSGAIGAIGATGLTGATGVTGSTGATGATGSRTGATGATGSLIAEDIVNTLTVNPDIELNIGGLIASTTLFMTPYIVKPDGTYAFSATTSQIIAANGTFTPTLPSFIVATPLPYGTYHFGILVTSNAPSGATSNVGSGTNFNITATVTTNRDGVITDLGTAIYIFQSGTYMSADPGANVEVNTLDFTYEINPNMPP